MNKTLKWTICTSVLATIMLTTQSPITMAAPAATASASEDWFKNIQVGTAPDPTQQTLVAQVAAYDNSLKNNSNVEDDLIKFCDAYHKLILEAEGYYNLILTAYKQNPKVYGPLIAKHSPKITHPKELSITKIAASSTVMNEQDAMYTKGYLCALAVYRSHWGIEKMHNGLMKRIAGDDSNNQKEFKDGWNAFVNAQTE